MSNMVGGVCGGRVEKGKVGSGSDPGANFAQLT